MVKAAIIFSYLKEFFTWAEILITNISERIQISMHKLLEDNEKNLKKLLPDIDIIEFEGMEDNKIKITQIGIQKTNQEKDLDMEELQQEILINTPPFFFLLKVLKKKLKTNKNEYKVKKRKTGKAKEKYKEEASDFLCSKYKYDYKIISYSMITKRKAFLSFIFFYYLIFFS